MENKDRKLDTHFMEYLGDNPSQKAQERFRETQGYKSNREKARGVLRVISCIVAGGFLWKYGPTCFDNLMLSFKILGSFASVIVILDSLGRVIDDEDKQM